MSRVFTVERAPGLEAWGVMEWRGPAHDPARRRVCLVRDVDHGCFDRARACAQQLVDLIAAGGLEAVNTVDPRQLDLEAVLAEQSLGGYAR